MTQGSSNTTEQYMYVRQFANTFTAGITRCRPDNQCGYHGRTNYFWCYTDYSNYWDYCCTGTCIQDFDSEFVCASGTTLTRCGNGANKDVSGRKCLDTHQCGLHMETHLLSSPTYYWCLVDLDENWGYCCSPFNKCGKHEKSYDWCKTGVYESDGHWQYCNTN
ncbi:hypothetical protein ACJMK2_030550 [Sinanodonta woodiana]|uniref:Uncharacterized protein n=1 Tax=Sinanodonta woodiana TaxID=1069815 RepID=A0ABD3WXP1_SINWO